VTAPNHALTGALIGLTITNPALALPLAFLSHLVCDAIPHYDAAEKDETKRLQSRAFVRDFLVIGAALCLALVVVLALARPAHWFQAAVCAFLATSPDLFWLPRFLRARRGQKPQPLRNWFMRFHAWVQWRTGPAYAWVETVWFGLFSALLISKL